MGALEAIKTGVVVLIGALVGWTLASLYADVVSIPAARGAGATVERIVWQERQRRAEAAAEAERQAAQTQIDAIEAEYLRREATRDAAFIVLESALEKERADAARRPRAACGPALSRELRDAVDRIGRPASRSSPAQSHGAMP